MRRRAFGTETVAKVCRVEHSTVNRWLDEGTLPFFTADRNRRKVWDVDLARFLKTRGCPIPRGLEPLLHPAILIVDDDPIIRKILRRVILKAYPKAAIYEAADGLQAGEQMASFRPSLIVLDVRMPGLSGFEVCARLRQNPATADVGIVMVSGDPRGDKRGLALSAGANAFLSKPFASDSFMKVVDRLLRQSPGRQAFPSETP